MNLIDKLYMIVMTGVLIALPSCSGMFAGVYDDPTDDGTRATAAGQLYVDASDWHEWHFIDLTALTDSTKGEWQTVRIPEEEIEAADSCDGIYTYWFDVFGAGIAVNEFRSFQPAAPQPEPERWTIAVHRNNVRTNGCTVAVTSFASFDELPADRSFLTALDFEADVWTENEVWCIQDRMLLGLIGSQGSYVSKPLSSWLTVDIPPVPPRFTPDTRVRVVRLPDGTCAALQLADYMNAEGVKCCLTINYRYPI